MFRIHPGRGSFVAVVVIVPSIHGADTAAGGSVTAKGSVRIREYHGCYRLELVGTTKET